MYTFKPQAKSNAKRFLVATCKVDAADVGQYLAQNADGEWGTYLGEDGKPVRHQLVYAEKRAAEGMAPAGVAGNDPDALAFDPVNGTDFGTERTVAGDALPAAEDLHAMAQASTAADPELAAALAQHDEDGNDTPDAQEAARSSAFARLAASQLGTQTPSTAAAEPERAGSGSSVKIQKDRPTANGITRPSAGTTCARVWALCEELTANMGRTAPLSVVVDTAKAQGINQFTARTQYACWRKFNGISGRVGK